PLLDVPRCEVLVYFSVSFLARFGDRPEFAATMANVFTGDRWRAAFAEGVDFEKRKRMLLDLFIGEMRKRVPYVRSFEITPAHEAGGNTYHLVFGTANADQGLRKMKDAMWPVDPSGGQGFRDSTVADNPVLFSQSPDFDEAWFSVEEAEVFILLERALRDNVQRKTPTLQPAEKRGALEVRPPTGQR